VGLSDDPAEIFRRSMLNAQGRDGLPKGGSVPVERREGEGESDERALLGAFGVDSRARDRSQAVSKPGRLKYWLFAALVIFAGAAAVGVFTLLPGVEERHLAPVAVPGAPNAPASVSDLLAKLQALQTPPSPDASAPPVAASSSPPATSPEPLKTDSSVAAANVVAPPAAPQSAPAQQAAPENAVRGVSDTEILFGMAAPFSGASRELGREMKIGVETAFDQINSAGGVNGRQLRLVAVDDGYEPARTADAMRVLYDKDRVFGFIGNVGTPTAAVALPFALDRRALFFGAFSGANLLRRDPPDRYVFNYRASYAEETNAVVRYLVNVKRIQPNEIVVFAQQDSYGDSGYAGVQKAVRSLPGDYPDIVRLNYKRNTVDVQDAVSALRAFKGKIKAVVMVASYRAAAKFIEKTRDLYPSLIYTNVSFVGSTELADELMLLGPRYAAGVVVTQVVPAINSFSSVVLKYKEALGKYFPGEAPDYVSFEGYIDGCILGEAVKRVGRDLNTEKLVDQFEKMRAFDLGLGAPVTFSDNEHQASHKVWGTQLDEAGHYQPIELE
jgi:branched-chain amino acid transport system substrate-binding protein